MGHKDGVFRAGAPVASRRSYGNLAEPASAALTHDQALDCVIGGLFPRPIVTSPAKSCGGRPRVTLAMQIFCVGTFFRLNFLMAAAEIEALTA
jgi:hypothetical protein